MKEEKAYSCAICHNHVSDSYEGFERHYKKCSAEEYSNRRVDIELPVQCEHLNNPLDDKTPIKGAGAR